MCELECENNTIPSGNFAKTSRETEMSSTESDSSFAKETPRWFDLWDRHRLQRNYSTWNSLRIAERHSQTGVPGSGHLL